MGQNFRQITQKTKAFKNFCATKVSIKGIYCIIDKPFPDRPDVENNVNVTPKYGGKTLSIAIYQTSISHLYPINRSVLNIANFFNTKFAYSIEMVPAIIRSG